MPTIFRWRLIRNLNFRVSTRSRRVHRHYDLWDRQTNEPPSPSAQHNDGYLASFEILLVADVLVGGYKYVKSGFLCGSQ